MSIEKNLSDLTDAVNRLADLLQAQNTAIAAPTTDASPTPDEAPTPAAKAEKSTTPAAIEEAPTSTAVPEVDNTEAFAAIRTKYLAVMHACSAKTSKEAARGIGMTLIEKYAKGKVLNIETLPATSYKALGTELDDLLKTYG